MKKGYLKLSFSSYKTLDKLMVKHNLSTHSIAISKIMASECHLIKIVDTYRVDRAYRIDFSIDSDIYLEFSAKCKKANMSVSAAIDFILSCQ